ncbi:MAG: hypothetical protein ACR2OL_06080 [Anderseniella sp.]
MPQYCVHGLLLESEFDIPELAASQALQVLDETPVEMVMTQLPSLIDHHTVTTDGYLLGDNEIMIALDNGIRCHVEAGNRISIDPGSSDNEPAARLFALSAGLGSLLHQRGYLPLHCAAVDTAMGCVAFCGNAGDGKSTLAASFRKSGFKLFSDDRLTIHAAVEYPYLAAPSIPALHLYEQSGTMAGLGDDHLAMDSYRFGKHIHLVPEAYSDHPRPVAGLYFTDWHEDEAAEPVIAPMGQLNAMMRLRRDVSLTHLIGPLGREQHFMTWAAGLCGSVPAFHLVRPRNADRHEDCMSLIISHVRDTFGT